MLTIRPETPADHDAIYEVEVAAFEKDEQAEQVESLRADDRVILSLIAEQDGVVVGHILFTRMHLHDLPPPSASTRPG